MNQTVQLAEALFRLQPFGSLPAERGRELAALVRQEHLPLGSDVLATRNLQRESVYLLRGEMRLVYLDGSSDVIVGGSDVTLHPLGKRAQGVRSAKSITDIELISIDDDVLDAMLTWDQLSGATEDEPAPDNIEKTGWYTESTLVRVQNLARGVFPALPQSAIDALLARAKRFRVHRDQTVVREGDVADYYFVIESGRCRVTRNVGGGQLLLAELGGGDAFGEDALIENTPRSATVTMVTDGVVLRIGKEDFARLLREPLLERVSRRKPRRERRRARYGSTCVSRRNMPSTRFPVPSTFPSMRFATPPIPLIRPRSTWCIAKAANAAPRRRSCCRSEATGHVFWTVDCAAGR